MRLLSPSIKAQVIHHEFFEVVSSQDVFCFDKNLVPAVLDKLSLSLYKPDEKICEQSSSPKSLFFLCRGHCEVYKYFDSVTELFLCNLDPGAMFGEIAAVLGCKSSATVRSRNYCTIATLLIEDYHAITQQFPKLAEKMS